LSWSAKRSARGASTPAASIQNSNSMVKI
jgi:hypothetical protein